MATDSFWADIGPYAIAALGFLIGGAYMDLKRDARWLRQNLINVMTELGIKPDN